MAARYEPGSTRRASDRHRRADSRHSIAQTDPLRWARDDDGTTVDLPAIGRGPADATTASLPALARSTRPGPDEATTAGLPALGGSTGPDIVDHRQPPVQPRQRQGPSARARRGYAGRHRQIVTVEPTRLGLSTAGMTVAIGVLGAALTIMHTDADQSTLERPQTPAPVTSPGTTAPAGAHPNVQSQQPLFPGATRTPATAGSPARADAARPRPAGAPAPQVDPAGAPAQSGTDESGEVIGNGNRSGQPSRTKPSKSSPRPTKASCPVAASTGAPDGDPASAPAVAVADASVVPQVGDASDEPTPDASATPSAAATCP
jgi:hypothetical protein